MSARPEHEKLAAYAHSLEAVEVLDAMAQRLPERRAELRDQLRRAAASIPLNIAQGAAEFSPAEKARFYRIARRSAAECLAVLDVIHRVEPDAIGRVDARAALLRVAGMLTLMVKAVEARPRRK